jgi:hypothetical protein
MAEFTKDIQTLTQQANSSPKLQTNTGSLATDVVSAVGFGLDLYRQNKAKTQLGEAKAQQASYDTKLAEGILGLRNKRLSLTDQGVNRATFLRKEAEYLKSQGGAEFQMAIIGATNTLTKQTTTTTAEGITAAEVAQAKTQQNLQETRQQNEVEASTALGKYGGTLDVFSASEEELQLAKVKGARFEATRIARISDMAEKRDALSDAVARQDQESRMFSYNTSSTLGPQLVSDMGTYIKAQSGLSPQNVPDTIEALSTLKANLTASVYAKRDEAVASGFYVSPAAINQSISDLESGVDRVISLISGADSLKALQNNTSLIFEGGIAKLLGGTKEEQDAAATLLTSKLVGSPPELKNFNTFTQFIINANKGMVDTGSADFPAILKGLPLMLGSTEKITPEQQVSNQQIMDGLLNSSPSKVKEVVTKGGLDAITKAVVAQGNTVLRPQDAEVTADLIYKAAVPSLAGNIQRLLTQETKDNTMNSEFGTMGLKQDIRNNYEFNTSTMQFNRTNRLAPRNAQVDQVNLLIKNTRSTFGVLGMDKAYVAGFDEDILMTLGMAPTK